jgi:hypothetical protein
MERGSELLLPSPEGEGGGSGHYFIATPQLDQFLLFCLFALPEIRSRATINFGSFSLCRGKKSVRRSPNLALTIFLYVSGILLVFMATVLLVQTFAKVTIPTTAIAALVLLAVGAGILAGVRRG